MNGALPILFMLVFVVVTILIVAAARMHHKESSNRVFSQVAEGLGGTLHPAAMLTEPAVSFEHRGHAARLDVISTGGNNRTYYTQLHFDWPERGLRCEVYPDGFLQRLGKLLGMTDLEIGSPQFDAEYTITGNRPGRIRELLSPGVQASIGQLRRFFGNQEIYVSFSGGMLLVKKKGYVRERGELLEFVRLGLRLYDEALDAGSEGITFLEKQGADEADATESMALGDGDAGSGPICQVCGEPITDRRVYCRSCRTPHHAECWRYYGACSTYGCGEKRCVPGARAARRSSA